MGKVLKAVFWILIYLVAFDLAGMLMNFIVEVLSVDFRFLAYTIWFVCGVLCAFLAYDAAGRQLGKDSEGDWSNSPESGKWGMIVIGLSGLILIGLSILFYNLYWRWEGTDGRYVPDSGAMSLTYFITIFGSMILAHTVFRPGASTKSS